MTRPASGEQTDRQVILIVLYKDRTVELFRRGSSPVEELLHSISLLVLAVHGEQQQQRIHVLFHNFWIYFWIRVPQQSILCSLHCTRDGLLARVMLAAQQCASQCCEERLLPSHLL